MHNSHTVPSENNLLKPVLVYLFCKMNKYLLKLAEISDIIAILVEIE